MDSPIPPKPISIIIQVAGSGTPVAAGPVTLTSSMPIRNDAPGCPAMVNADDALLAVNIPVSCPQVVVVPEYVPGVPVRINGTPSTLTVIPTLGSVKAVKIEKVYSCPLFVASAWLSVP